MKKRSNKNVWPGILAMALVFGMTVVGCDNNSTKKKDNGITIDGWTWTEYDDSEDQGTSTITMKQGSGSDSKKINFTGNVTADCPNGEWPPYGYAGAHAEPNKANLAALKNANGFSFKCKGDGKTYYFQFITSDVTEFNYFQYRFEASETEQTILISYDEIVQPLWGTQVGSFNKNLITQVEFNAHTDEAGEGPFAITFWDLQALQTVDKTKKTPEEMIESERWANKWVDPETSVTITNAATGDGVRTITVGGIPASERWQGNVGYLYTGKKDAHYTYKIEAWTQSGNRTINAQYFGGGDVTTIGGPPYLGQALNITSTRKTYTFVGENLPRGGVIPLEIQCADQTGTFYIKVVSITEGGVFSDNENIDRVMIRSVSPDSDLTDGVETEFTVIVDYLFYGFEHGLLTVQFNSYDAEGQTMSMLGDQTISTEGKGTHTFTVQETPKDHSPDGDFYVRCELGCWNGSEDEYYGADDFTQFFTAPFILSFE